MSKLLHSKTFRKNLFKWFALYICVMLCTYSVITYSKYISDLQANSSTRTAKFVLDVQDGDICSVSSPDVCNIDYFKPYDQIDYKFSIDTNEIEVSTLLVANIVVNSNFTIVGIYEDGEEIIIASDDRYTKTGNTIKITETVGITNVFTRDYTLRLSFNGTGTSFSNAVTVNYAATQID